MSRLVLTSDRMSEQRAHDLCGNLGLNTSGRFAVDNCYARSYEKPAHDTATFRRIDSDGFICFGGTVVYDGLLNRDGLGDLYELFLSEGVEAVRSTILGHYAMAIKTKSSLTVFTDALGSLALYYWSQDDRWFLSNSLFLCAAGLQAPRVDPIRLLAQGLQSDLPADRTIYSRIRRLGGSQVVRIDLTTGAFSVEWLQLSRGSLWTDATPLSEAVRWYESKVRSVFDQLTSASQIGIMTTGGLDSRTVLAGVLDAGIAPVVLTGSAHNRVTNTSSRDEEIARTIADRYGLDFQAMDWSDDQPLSRKELERRFEMHGFSYEVYGAPDRLVEDLRGGVTSDLDLLLGGYSPAFTNRKPWEDGRERFTLDDLLDDYVHPAVEGDGFACKEAYRTVLRRDIETALDLGELIFKSENFSLRQFVESRLALRIHTDARFANFVNQFCNYIDPFRLRELYQPLVTAPPRFRRRNQLQIGLIEHLHQDLLDVPLFTGWKNAQLNDGGLEIVGRELTIGDRLSTRYIRDKTRNLVSRYVSEEWRNRGKRLGYKVLPGWFQDYGMRTVYGSRIADRGIFARCLPDPSALPVKEMSRLEYLLVGVETLSSASFDSVSVPWNLEKSK